MILILTATGMFLLGLAGGSLAFLLTIAPTLKWANERIDGLDSELRQAVLCAYLRGAKDWAVSNYPDWREWLESHEDYAQ